MRERITKLLLPWKRTPEIIQQCLDWVGSIVEIKNRRYVSVLSSVDRYNILQLTV